MRVNIQALPVLYCWTSSCPTIRAHTSVHKDGCAYQKYLQRYVDNRDRLAIDRATPLAS